MKILSAARHWARFASVRLALAAGAVTGWAATDPDGAKALVLLLPEWSRPMVGLAVAGAAIWSRIHPQPKLEGRAR